MVCEPCEQGDEPIKRRRGGARSGEQIEELRREIMRLKIRLTYVSVECDWYREACETWLRHSDGCAADIGDEYRCKCGLRRWLAENKRRRETVYKEGERR